MYVKYISSPPGKAVSCTKNYFLPPPHGKAKFPCSKTYFFPPGKAKFHVPKLVLPFPLGRLNFMY